MIGRSPIHQTPFLQQEAFMVKVDRNECVGCETCVPVCPVEAISMKDEKAYIDPDTCTECETCIAECPVEAIKKED
jgi:ferredoxin